MGEERHCVGDECVGLPGLNPARTDECGDALQGGDEEQAEAFGVAGRELADLLSLADQVADRSEQALGRLVQRAGRFGVLGVQASP